MDFIGENNIFLPYFIEYFDREYVSICKFQFSQQSKQYFRIDCKNSCKLHVNDNCMKLRTRQ